MDNSIPFHESSKDKLFGGRVHIPRDHTLWPESWKIVEYKAYPRFKTIKLSEPSVAVDFLEVIKTRKSKRDFPSREMTEGDISFVLKYSCGLIDKDNELHRAQPSAGGRFPLEVYPVIFRGIGNVLPGVYHYNVKEHGLDELWQRRFLKQEIDDLFSYSWASDATVAFIITACFERSKRKYGERGYRYVMLEGGHLGQNIYLTAEALKLNVIGLGGTNDVKIEELLDIDGFAESLVYVLVVG